MAKNDLDLWLSNSGLSEKYPTDNRPNALVLNALEKEFSVPKPAKFSSNGSFAIKFSSPVKIPNMRDSFLNKNDSQKKQQSRNLKGDNSKKEYASRVR